MENREIYKLIERQEDNVRELFNAHNTALRAKIEAETSIIGVKIDALAEHQRTQNDRTAKLEENTERLAKDTRIWRLIHRNPKASSIVIGLTLIGIIALFILKMALISILFFEEIRQAQKRDPAAKSFLEVLLLYHSLSERETV